MTSKRAVLGTVLAVLLPVPLGLRGENGGLVAAVPVRDAQGHVLDVAASVPPGDELAVPGERPEAPRVRS